MAKRIKRVREKNSMRPTVFIGMALFIFIFLGAFFI